MQIKSYVLLRLELFQSVFLRLTCVGSLVTNSVVEHTLYASLVRILNWVSVLQAISFICTTPPRYLIHLKYRNLCQVLLRIKYSKIFKGLGYCTPYWGGGEGKESLKKNSMSKSFFKHIIY